MKKLLFPGWLFLTLVLGVGLIHGLLYVFIVPPWQHNDEPNHFEYVWLATHRSTLPSSTDFDPDMSRAVMLSMAANHFFDGMSYKPDFLSGKPVHISGYSQLADLPLYYLLASVPLRLVGVVAPGASIETQLYVTRLASLLFLLISLVAAWELARELFSLTNPLRWLVPITLALWPGYIDLMTAVTNLTGAVAFFSLFIWFGVRLIRRGLGWFDVTGAILTAAACIWTISGVYVVIPLMITCLLFASFRGRRRWWSWVFLSISIICVLPAVFSWGDVDLWYRETLQTSSTRTDPTNTPLGENVFRLVVSSERQPSSLYQIIPPSSARGLRGKTVSFGAWIWASRPFQVNFPPMRIKYDYHPYKNKVTITETPTFYVITDTLKGDTSQMWVTLSLQASKEGGGTQVFFDGVVFADGSYPMDIPPIYDNADGERGSWGGKPFVNLLRNASAENAGPRIRLWVDRRNLFGSYGRVSMMLYAVRDWTSLRWYYRATAANVFRTFWGRFGWNHVPLLGHKPYRGLLFVSSIGLAGAFSSVWRSRKSVNIDLVVWLGLGVFMLGALAVTRGVFEIWYSQFIPSARYLYPLMALLVLSLCAGWWEVLRISEHWVPARIRGLIYLAFFIGLDIYAIASLAVYYY